MPEDVMFQEALDAIRQGQRARARDLLTRLLRTDQSNPQYWLWMSSVVETKKEQIFCLQSALRLDPDNQDVRQGLVLLGALPPDESIKPVFPVRRKWEVALQDVPKRRLWSNPAVRVTTYLILMAALFGLVYLGVTGLGMTRKPTAVAHLPTETTGPSPTFTYTPTSINFTPRAPTRTPTYAGPPPLWTLLQATYTPTPSYYATPHPENEAFIIAQRAYQRGNYESALSNLSQALQMSPNAVDIYCFGAEIYRQRGDVFKALEYYEKAIAIDPNFAPAYLGRARVRFADDPEFDMLEDLQLAIDKDPDYGEAYVELAGYQLRTGELETALETLAKAETLLPGSPLVYLYRAQILLKMEENESALEDARQANQLDLTMLDSYRVLGEAALAGEQYDEAAQALEVYTVYAPKDAHGWVLLSQALFATENYSDTLTALDQALEIDEELPGAHLYRGLVFLELGRGQEAVNELYNALTGDRQSFMINLNFGRALFVAERYEDARGHLTRTLEMAQTDEELAQVYYWRALAFEALGDRLNANKDWKALLALPEEAVPAEWIEVAQKHMKATSTPTPKVSPTPKASATPTAGTPSPTQKTPTPGTRTPTPKGTSTPTPTPTKSPTPTKTPTQ
ncbi:MAG: tetratricopeptide repeat protein [Anaerolineales bacterium]|nr:tetratricopeptide repeat protein [Anaerolineales bacterium]